ncbi:MAG TPA: amidohydrolase family protein [Puia sp.]|nr:amidohydrolase family protein [Puia sp.]
MAYRKFKADHLFTGQKLLGQDQVLITETDGRVESIVPLLEAGSDIEQLHGILSPGFINCHCHLELSHLRGLVPTGTGLVDFIYKVVTERHFPQEIISQAIIDADNELFQNGIVAVGDICNNTDTIQVKNGSRLYYHNFIEVAGWNPAVADIRFERSKSVYDEYERMLTSTSKNSHFNVGGLSMAPHSPYSISNELWEKIEPFYIGFPTSIHNQESPEENELFVNGNGDFLRLYELLKIENPHFAPTKKSSLQSYLSRLSSASSLILVHNTFISEQDLEYLQDPNFSPLGANLSFCLCPNANLYIENSLPPIQLLRKYNCKIVLGTDSLASNDQLNILKEAQTIAKNFPGIAPEEMLQWCTSNGADALGIKDEFGSFLPGKKPGINLIETNGKDQLNDKTGITRIL